MTTFFELGRYYLRLAAADLKDLGRFILRPRHYLHLVAHEPWPVILRKLAVCAILFAIIEITLFFPLNAPELIGPHVIVGVAILEVVVFSLWFFPAFLVAARWAGWAGPVKVALSYSVLFRLIYISIPLVLYSIFVLTEDYAFALLKGVATYSFVLAYVLVFPVIITRRIWRRVVAIGLTVIVGVGTCIGTSFLMRSETGKPTAQFSLFYDPIGAEISGIDWDLSFLRGERLRGITSALSDALDAALEELDKPSVTAAPIALDQVSDDWQPLRTLWLDRIEVEERSFERHRKEARFSTTRRLIDLALMELSEARDVVFAMDETLGASVGSRIPKAFIRVLDQHNELLNVQLERATVYNENLSIRVRLLRLGLLVN